MQTEVIDRAAMIKAFTRISSSRGSIVVILAGLILFGCQKESQPKKTEVEATDKVEKFLRHAMITHAGIYTLLGAKPITEFSNLTTEPTHEQLVMIYNRMSQKVRSQHSFEEVSPHFKEEYELWDAWNKVKNSYTGDNFRFFSDPRCANRIVFVNLSAVALVLDEYYEDFKRVYGKDFEATNIVYSIDSKDSIFWSLCLSDHYLAGLLYGFGKASAKLFAWEHCDKKPGKAKTGSCGKFPVANNPSINELLIPSFAIYSPIDEKLLFYRVARNEIISLFKDADFKRLTLSILKDDEKSFTGLKR